MLDGLVDDEDDCPVLLLPLALLPEAEGLGAFPLLSVTAHTSDMDLEPVLRTEMERSPDVKRPHESPSSAQCMAQRIFSGF